MHLLRNKILVMIGDNLFNTRIWISFRKSKIQSLGSVRGASDQHKTKEYMYHSQYNSWTHDICPID